MTDRDPNELLRELFRRAIVPPLTEPVPPEEDLSHPVHDIELLDRWSFDELTEEEHRRIVDHLAECAYCRRELASMIRDEVLTLPVRGDVASDASEKTVAGDEANENGVDRVSPVVRDRSTHRRTWLFAIAAVAASLLVAVLWQYPRDMGDSTLALAQRDLTSGRHAEAMDRVDRFLAEQDAIAPKDRADAVRILETSGYQLARQRLGEGNIKGVFDVEARTTQHAATSGQLLNLRLQAERGITSEHTLSTKGSLTDYGYELDGHSYSKGSFPTFDEKSERLDREFAAAVVQHPDSVELRLNYGQFLIDQYELERAIEQFTIAARLAPNNPAAHTGLGLALFQQKPDASHRRALTHFQTAAELSPSDPIAKQNLAICRKRLEE